MRMALTKMVPIGSTNRTIETSSVEPDVDARIPRPMPATSAPTTQRADA
jgi:hypothetical protein